MASRPRAWGNTLLKGTVIGGGASLTPLNLLGNLVNLDTLTVVRLIGHLWLHPANVDTNEQVQAVLDLGVGVCSQEAFTAGVVPDPSVASDVPQLGWLWRDSVLFQRSNSSSFGEEMGPARTELRFDIRAARKVDRGVLYLAADNTAVGSNGSVSLSGIVRALFLT